VPARRPGVAREVVTESTERAPEAAAAEEAEDPQRIVDIELDERSVVRWSIEVEHERRVAIFDLLEQNHFAPVGELPGPYAVRLSLRDTNLVFDIRCRSSGGEMTVVLSARPLRRVIKDYFLICESYFAAIKNAPPSQIEAIDMGRRGLHNEAAELLREALAGKIEIDVHTSRRLFTLISLLHIRA
jgi:uncharacterized protein (UPF0262 family)